MSAEMRHTARPFGGYDAIRSDRIDTELCLVDKGTPCGEYLRRFWQPIALASDLGDVPVAIKILGEELVVFRDKSGGIGLLHRYCSHRGTSLELALIVDHGIRCAYHGWHFATDGRILDVPGEAKSGTIAKQMCHGAYPTHEIKGLVFAYLGPIDEMPPFPNYDFMDFAGEEYVPFIWHNPCNWLQLRENTQDPIHLTFLHSMFAIKQFGDYAYDLPYIRAHQTPIGQITTSVRRVHDVYYCRVNELILPNIARVPDGFALNEAIPANKAGHPGEHRATTGLRYKRQLPSSHGLGLSTWIVPNDNTNAMHMGWLHLPEGDDPVAREHQIVQISFGQTGERSAAERRQNPGDWDAWVAQGPIASRDNDNLTAADAGIALFRRQLRDGIRAVAAGQVPKGLTRERNATTATYGYALTRPAPAADGPEDEALRKAAYERDAVADILAERMPHLPRILEPA
jgi:nitrite reductase/ring-hydroxylating ferredoxin subunit